MTYKECVSRLTCDWTEANRSATVYLDGKPVATAQRRGVYDYDAPRVTIYRTDGSVMARSYLGMSGSLIVRRVARALAQEG